jgi:hypothetical protein
LYELAKVQYVTHGEVHVSRRKSLLVGINVRKRYIFPIKRDFSYCLRSVIAPSVGMIYVSFLLLC